MQLDYVDCDDLNVWNVVKDINWMSKTWRGVYKKKGLLKMGIKKKKLKTKNKKCLSVTALKSNDMILVLFYFMFGEPTLKQY